MKEDITQNLLSFYKTIFEIIQKYIYKKTTSLYNIVLAIKTKVIGVFIETPNQYNDAFKIPSLTRKNKNNELYGEAPKKLANHYYFVK